MTFTPANAASLAAFNGILVAVLAALLWAIQRSYRSAKVTGPGRRSLWPSGGARRPCWWPAGA